MADIILSSGLIPVGLISLALCIVALVGAEKSSKKAAWPTYLMLSAVSLVVVWAIFLKVGIRIM